MPSLIAFIHLSVCCNSANSVAFVASSSLSPKNASGPPARLVHIGADSLFSESRIVPGSMFVGPSSYGVQDGRGFLLGPSALPCLAPALWVTLNGVNSCSAKAHLSMRPDASALSGFITCAAAFESVSMLNVDPDKYIRNSRVAHTIAKHSSSHTL